jgi:hypothetical protein
MVSLEGETMVSKTDVDLKVLDGRVRRLCKRTVTDKIPLKRKKNCKYSKNKILEVPICTAFEGTSIEEHTKFRREVNNEEIPDADTVFYAFKNLKSEDILEVSNKTSRELLKLAKSNNLIPTRGCYVSLDFTDQLYYGKSLTQAISTVKDKHSKKVLRFATLTIVEEGRRFTPAWAPFPFLSSKTEVIEPLLREVLKWMKIKELIMDAGFFCVEIMLLCNRFGIKWVIRAPKNKKIKELMKGKLPKVIDYEMKNQRGEKVNFKLVIQKGRKEKIALATNMDVSKKTAYLPLSIFDKRWGIETSNRVEKQEFKAKTCSRKYSMRLFFFLLQIALYNIWILCNSLIIEEVNYLDPGTYPVRARRMRKVFFLTTLNLFPKSMKCV